MLNHNGIQMCWYTPVFTRSDFRLSYFGDANGREYIKILVSSSFAQPFPH